MKTVMAYPNRSESEDIMRMLELRFSESFFEDPKLRDVRRAVTDTPDPTLRDAFALAGLKVLAAEIQTMIDKLQEKPA
jgi:hypothetical protein